MGIELSMTWQRVVSWSGVMVTVLAASACGSDGEIAEQGGRAPAGGDAALLGVAREPLVIPSPTGCMSQSLGSSVVDLWVAPNGSDANPGTAAQPLLTLAGAHAKITMPMTSDYRINVKSGLYRGQMVKWSKYSANHRIHILPASTVGKPIFDGMRNGDTKSRRAAFFDLVIPAGGSAVHTNISISGLTIKNYVQHGIKVGSRGDGASMCNVITNNEFYNIGDAIAHCDGEWLDNDYFDCYDAQGNPIPESAWPNPADAHCRCNDRSCPCTGYGGISLARSSNNVIAQNRFVDLVSTRRPTLIHGLYFAHSSHLNVAQENYIRNCTGSPIKFRDRSYGSHFIENYVERSGQEAFISVQEQEEPPQELGPNLFEDNWFTFPQGGDTHQPLVGDHNGSVETASGQDGAAFLQQGLPSRETVTAMVSADVDGDGDDETFVALYYSDPESDEHFTKVVYSKGTNTRLLSRVAYSSAHFMVPAMTAADFDGDGKAEIITAFTTPAGDQTHVHRGTLTGGGSYSLTGGGKLLATSGSSAWKISAMTAAGFGGAAPKLYTAKLVGGVQQIVRGDGVTPTSGTSGPGVHDGTVVYSSSSWEISAMTAGRIGNTSSQKLITAFRWIGSASPKNRIYLGDGTATNGATNLGSIFDSGSMVVQALSAASFAGGVDHLLSAFDDGGTARVYLNSTTQANGTELYSSSAWKVTAMAGGNLQHDELGKESVVAFDNAAQTQVHVGSGNLGVQEHGALYVWP